ncbi:transcriptional regulator [Rhodopseudomonas sp. AAP120]|uniref:Lrp/AsnC family transcriptional regulator n=1 Tax=Rhodopseudomonas sp. AAP120 TaxID=1523430 RepID=UPI0006B90853|nr:Lrp/AsnC family transcriptional regulator [Rhodopseudomonas sp. AAP120]KPF92990.1 transcriptional regulator [Rhodopseudomonas sp. AAP120]
MNSAPPETSRALDRVDFKILRLLQEDATLSVADVANQVGLSSTPCWKRIQRLQMEGVITGRVALVDQDKIGLGLSVFVFIESGDHSKEWQTSFAATLKAMPQIVDMYRLACDFDYVLRVVVPDMKSFDQFYRTLIGAAALKNVTSRFAMEKIKSVTALPIASAEHARSPAGVSA